MDKPCDLNKNVWVVKKGMEKEYCITFRRREKTGWLRRGWRDGFHLVVAHKKESAVRLFEEWADENSDLGFAILKGVYVEYKKKR